MNRKCPQCDSVETGPSLTFDYNTERSGQVVVRNPFFTCAGCEHSWQVEMVLMVAQTAPSADNESVANFVNAINGEVSDVD
ncbi:MAG: hypothetical protein P8M16_10375 [Acidimicrobiales bacterium]|nr:hypothetical protein [Acidimicrobiales bacterium]